MIRCFLLALALHVFTVFILRVRNRFDNAPGRHAREVTLVQLRHIALLHTVLQSYYYNLRPRSVSTPILLYSYG